MLKRSLPFDPIQANDALDLRLNSQEFFTQAKRNFKPKLSLSSWSYFIGRRGLTPRTHYFVKQLQHAKTDKRVQARIYREPKFIQKVYITIFYERFRKVLGSKLGYFSGFFRRFALLKDLKLRILLAKRC